MDKFFSDLQKNTPASKSSDLADETPQPSDDARATAEKKRLPKGVVLGKDGKPCRSCTSVSAWMQMANQTSSSPPKSSSSPAAAKTASSATLPSNCPPDVETLGRSTWTFLHTLAASYPPAPTTTEKTEMAQFLTLFGKLYPCWHCAEDFRSWMKTPGNEVRRGVEGQDGLSRWMCEAHNEVNRKLGKRVFDCGRWRERWGEGPQDGSCG